MKEPSTNPSDLPVAIIGAGPIGLAAASHVLARGYKPLIFEAGTGIASHLESYRHVRLFSNWKYNVDGEAARLLETAGWKMPVEEELPTAGELIDQYLMPLSKMQSISESLLLGHKVTAITREGYDKTKSKGRESAPFVLRTQSRDGHQSHRAWAVLDASGTWGNPNPLGADGLPVIGEDKLQEKLLYGMPDVLGQERNRYIGKCTLVVGAGHSAIGSLVALSELANMNSNTRVVWVVRGGNLERIFGGGDADGLPARGALGVKLRQLVDSGRLQVFENFRITTLTQGTPGIEVSSDDGRHLSGIDQIISATGSRPNVDLSRELRLNLDYWIESTEALAPLIDPNVHSCGTVRPHGYRELKHPELNFYVIGAKSYGRAPNFLMATGYEQARSVVAALSGDMEAADDVRLELPETGVCSTDFLEPASARSCCAPKVDSSGPISAGIARSVSKLDAQANKRSCCK